ncbi:MAG: T9SS type A sorting domain-containing protein [Verrucomicrobia bacterium]|nr:T9SS type A sorting domain-containing protein [Cytophagales bacterium]
MKRNLHFLLLCCWMSGQTAFALPVSTSPVRPLHLSPKIALQDEEFLFTDENVSFSAIYPNPASERAFIDYNFHKDNTKAKLFVMNVLGNRVGEYNFSKEAKRLTIATKDLASGVYFYTLSVGGKNVITRRLIVKHS